MKYRLLDVGEIIVGTDDLYKVDIWNGDNRWEQVPKEIIGAKVTEATLPIRRVHYHRTKK